MADFSKKFKYIGGTGERRMYPLKTDDISLVLKDEIITVRCFEDYDVLKRSDKYEEIVDDVDAGKNAVHEAPKAERSDDLPVETTPTPDAPTKKEVAK